MAQSEVPFGPALQELMAERGLTFRALAEVTRGLDGKGLTHAYLNQLAKGHDKASLRAMELIAQACEIDPDYFAEYRLAAGMRRLDPDQVGLDCALANLSALMCDRREAAARERHRRRRPARPRPSGSGSAD